MRRIGVFLKKRRFEICLFAFLAFFAFAAVRVRGVIRLAGRSGRAESARATPAEAPAPEDRAEAMVLPGRGALLAAYSPDVPVWSETMRMYAVHTGVDYACDPDGSVFVCRAGRVRSVETDCLYGLTVTVEHADGSASAYASLSEAFTSPGAYVSAGERIGRAGTSAACEAHLGAHVHFARFDGAGVAKPPFGAD